MRRHVVIIHRWRDEYARYADYIDHGTDQVSYVTTELGRSSVPGGAGAVSIVPATDDAGPVTRAVAGLAARFGAPHRVVALNEGDLDTAALVRERLGCPGQHRAQLARFRDKLVMATAVAAAGVTVPAFAAAPDAEAVREFAGGHGWPVVVKPRSGTASRGFTRLDSAADLRGLRGLSAEPHLVQEFCGDPIYHIDGLWLGDRLGPWRASRYINTCADFTRGSALGSVETDDARVLEALGEFTAAVAGALSREPWVFHLEAFVGTAADGRPRVSFLEVGYRAGGAEIPFLWREVHGIDLMRAAVDVQLGRRPCLPAPDRWRTAGWLLFPTPVPAPCLVTGWDLPASADPGAQPYASVIPPVGGVVPRAGGYEHVGARFRFRGDSTSEVENAIVRTAALFRLDCVPEQTVLDSPRAARAR